MPAGAGSPCRLITQETKRYFITFRLLLQLDKKKSNVNIYILNHTDLINYLHDYGLNVKQISTIQINTGTCLPLRQLETVLKCNLRNYITKTAWPYANSWNSACSMETSGTKSLFSSRKALIELSLVHLDSTGMEYSVLFSKLHSMHL